MTRDPANRAVAGRGDATILEGGRFTSRPLLLTIEDKLADLLRALGSVRAAGKASGCFGRSVKLRRSGRLTEALDVAREGLGVLSAPGVDRPGSPEASVVVMLTIQVEQLAHTLGEPGASPRDLADSIEFLQSLPAETNGQAAQLREQWLPYFEARLAQLARQGASNA